MSRTSRISNFSLRIAGAQDERAVTALLEASYTELMKHNYDLAALSAALPNMTRANPRLLSSGTYYVAHNDSGLIVGSGGWSREPPPGTGNTDDHVAHIRHFATHPQWIRRGIGRSIYARCEREARKAGIVKFECYSSLNGKGFYAALGFEVLRRVDLSIGTGKTLPSVLMARPI